MEQNEAHPYTIIADEESGEGGADLDELMADLASSTTTSDESQAENSDELTSEDPDWLPSKWKGKTQEEWAHMYRNLESAHGRMANDLGTQRKLTDQILLDKRARDLGISSEEAASREPERKPRELNISATDLLERPDEVLGKQFDALEESLEGIIERKLGQRDSQTAEEKFYQKYGSQAEVSALVTSDEFREFVQASPLRARAAATVAQTQDLEIAAVLIDEFNSSAAASGDSGDKDATSATHERAKQASLERASASSESTSTRKIWRRTDLIRLKMERPERYEELNDEIVRAYAEGRVR